MARDQRKQYDSTQNFTASSQVAFDLNRDNPIQELLIVGEFQFTSAAGGSIAAVPESSPWTAIKSIQLVANGADVVKSYDGPMLYDINYFDFGTVPPCEFFEIGASTNTGLFKSGLIISLEALGMAKPQDTWLDGRLLTSLELRLIFGTTADIGTFTNITSDVHRYTVYGKEILDIAPESVFAVNQETMSVTAFPATSATQRRFRQNIGNAYRRFIIQTRDQNSRAVVDRLTKIALLEQGSFYRRSMPASAYKILNSFRRAAVGIDLQASSGNTLTQHPRFPVVAASGPGNGESGGYRQGTYLIDIAEDGSTNALLNTIGYSSLDLELDWNGSNVTDLIRILTSTYVPQIR